MSVFSSIDPADGSAVWTGPAAGAEEVAAAVNAARQSLPSWSRRPLEERTEILRTFARTLQAHEAELARMISREVGKPDWEARTEVQSMAGKVELSVRAFDARCRDFTGGAAITRFRPHGVVAVLGPFNFPGHLPNGHIVPALLAGNTVIFKPSEFAPGTAGLTASFWQQAGLPAGVLNVVQGGPETGALLSAHAGLDGLFFTGSARAGAELARQAVARPHRILALELGGNNPLVVWPPCETDAAALLVVQSAFLSAGQRCTCARRLIIPDDTHGQSLLTAIDVLAGRIRVGRFDEVPEPFMGPVISAAAADRLLTRQTELIQRGAVPLRLMRSLCPGTGLLSPGLLDVTAIPNRPDEEFFGPLLQVVRVPTFDDALTEANATAYGLAAGLISRDRTAYTRFLETIRAGVVNWNQPLTGASGAAPFGGLGRSGNHRPSGFFAADYCSHPVASIEAEVPSLPSNWPKGIDPPAP